MMVDAIGFNLGLNNVCLQEHQDRWWVRLAQILVFPSGLNALSVGHWSPTRMDWSWVSGGAEINIIITPLPPHPSLSFNLQFLFSFTIV